MELSYITVKIVTEQDPEQVEQDIRVALGSKAIDISEIIVETDSEESDKTLTLTKINPQMKTNTVKFIRSIMGLSLRESDAVYQHVARGTPFNIRFDSHYSLDFVKSEFENTLGCSVEIKEN